MGIIVGVYLKDVQNGNKPFSWNPISKNCQYGGKIYKSGEGFPAEDGCNRCSCNDGQVTCTLMACK